MIFGAGYFNGAEQQQVTKAIETKTHVLMFSVLSV